MVKNILIACSLFSSLILNSQSDLQKKENKNSLFLFSAGYRLPLATGKIINSGHGPYVEAGINPAWFFSDKTIIGLYAGWAWKDNLWNTSFNERFLNDYYKAIDTEQSFSSLDSSIIAASYHIFSTRKGRSLTLPGCEMRSFHNYSLYYGLILKLPFEPSLAFKIYTGSTRSHYHGNGNLITTQMDYNILQLRRKMYGAEIVLLDPLRFLNSQKKVFKHIGLSIYYEYCDFYTSALYFDDGKQSSTISLKRFTNPAFLNKYKHEQSFGIKLSFNVI